MTNAKSTAVYFSFNSCWMKSIQLLNE